MPDSLFIDGRSDRQLGEGVETMEVFHPRCCGLDIHKKTVVACLIMPDEAGQPTKQVRTFSTMTDDLLALADWLAEADCTTVAMESTGVYWKPIYNLLEDRFQLLLVNPAHMKAVPGHKTDVKDCEWLADLLRHGLLKASFVPDREQRELRELTRYRTSLVDERAAAVNRVQKMLEGANIKLSGVATDIMGVSGRAMLEALMDEGADPKLMAELAKGRLRSKRAELERALSGRFGPHQRFMLAEQLAHIDFLDEAIQRVRDEIAARMAPFAEQLDRLDTIPGVGLKTAEVIVAEVGVDMDRFRTAGHLASWSGMCPGNNESAGKRYSGRTRKGNPALRRALVEAANAAARAHDTYLAAQYRRLKTRAGHKKAIIAVGHSILVIAYYLLKDHALYQDLGPFYFAQRDKEATKNRLIKRLKDLDYDVTVTPKTSAA